MLVLEGPDGAGKTTLAQNIEDQYGLMREPRAVSSDAVSLTPIDEWIEEQLAKKFGWRMYDRFALISSPMYMSLPNRTFTGRLTDLNWQLMVQGELRSIRPYIIWCMPPLENVIKNVLADETSRVMWDKIEEIYFNYVAAIGARPPTSYEMVWDYTNPNPNQVEAFIRATAFRSGHEL